ncbi:MAG TPA: glycine cleavage system aminomethyltransferase GcvT [Alphaproteobacteria bacterium]|nr:glycine cleavage system aminomethyltransferase GcvT [Alphaproteobacteria bacterium]
MTDTATLHRTPLHALHVSLGAKMVPFAGYDMPVQYPTGIIAEHQHCRTAAALFDVSHMGQVRLDGTDAVAALETLVPGDVAALAPTRTRYTMFTLDDGGIIDDLMVTNAGDHLFMVVNAGGKAEDIAHMREKIGKRVKITPLEDRALLALQGPHAAQVMARLAPPTASMKFMSFATATIDGIACFVTRSGYTGEDGYEISVPADKAERFTRKLLEQPEVKPAGLGARDSLRLEAGLCLYGHDIDRTTTPAEADLGWTVSKRRRASGGFPGAKRILGELANGPQRLRVGILPDGRAPAREHTKITDMQGNAIGEITSGGFGPTVGGPVAMGYVARAHAKPGTQVQLVVRDVPRPAKVVTLPFTPHRYFKG